VNLRVEDYYPSGKRFLLRFKEKGGKEKELPVHHKLEELLDQYLKTTGLEKEPESPLFPAAIGKTGKLSRWPLVRTDAADMLKRRLKQAGLPAHFRPTRSGQPVLPIFWKMTARSKPPNASLATRIAARRNSMTAAVRRFCSRIWRGFGIS
jgi:integrase